MMNRRGFLKRMAFAAVASGLLGSELFSRTETACRVEQSAFRADVEYMARYGFQPDYIILHPQTYEALGRPKSYEEWSYLPWSGSL